MSFAQKEVKVSLTNSCIEPIIVSDTVSRLMIRQQLDKVWFKFKAKEELTYLNIFPDDGSTHCDHLIFESINGNICDSIDAKKLIPLRNKVCDHSYEIDAHTRLSYEAIHDGICLCNKCCYISSPIKTKIGQVYYVIVYGNFKYIDVGLNSEGMKKIAEPELYEYDPFDFFIPEVGKSVQLENILFKSNQPKLLTESYPMLEKLTNFMKKNPTLSIEIQGHVNAPDEKSSLKSLKLSEDRARAVCLYLIESGIESKRMTIKGYGNSKMIYPKARTEAEFRKNRRVEILITGK